VPELGPSNAQRGVLPPQSRFVLQTRHVFDSESQIGDELGQFPFSTHATHLPLFTPFNEQNGVLPEQSAFD